jgi:TonB family protein
MTVQKMRFAMHKANVNVPKVRLFFFFFFIFVLGGYFQFQSIVKASGKKIPPNAKKTTDITETARLVATARYLVAIHAKIQALWKVKGIPFMELHRRSATVHLWIKPDGLLGRIKVIQSSSYKPFDASLLKAIGKAQAFARPPFLLQTSVQKDGLEIHFRRRVFLKKRLPLNTKYKGKSVLGNWQKRRRPVKRRPTKRRK